MEVPPAEWTDSPEDERLKRLWAVWTARRDLYQLYQLLELSIDPATEGGVIAAQVAGLCEGALPIAKLILNDDSTTAAAVAVKIAVACDLLGIWRVDLTRDDRVTGDRMVKGLLRSALRILEAFMGKDDWGDLFDGCADDLA